MAKISALILAKNEERNIKACIETLSFADEILVIDDFSTDKTKEIAESLGARVIQHGMNGDWANSRLLLLKMPDMNGSYLLMRMSGFPSLWQKKSVQWQKKVIKRPIGFGGKINSTIIMQPMAFCGRTT